MMPSPTSPSRPMGMRRGNARNFAVLAVAFFALAFLSRTDAALAAAAGSGPVAPGRQSFTVIPAKPVETRGMARPGLLSTEERQPDMVHLLFPNDGAIFPEFAVISLLWMPPSEDILVNRHPQAFEITLVSNMDNVMPIRRVIPVREKQIVFSSLLWPSASGAYQWQVAAIMENGLRIPSKTRALRILP